MSTNPHPQPALHDPPDSGTPIVDYVGPAAIAPLASATPAPIAQPANRSTDHALRWTKRVHITLVAVYLVWLFYSNFILNHYFPSIWGNIVPIILWLVGMGVARERSCYAEYGFIAVVSAGLGLGALLNGLQFIEMLYWTSHDGVSLAFSYIAQDIVSLIIAVGFILLASFAMLRSLKAWRATIGLLAMITSVVGGLLSKIQYMLPYANAYDEMVRSLYTIGQWLSIWSLVLIFFNFIWPGGTRRQRRNPPAPPNVKSQG